MAQFAILLRTSRALTAGVLAALLLSEPTPARAATVPTIQQTVATFAQDAIRTGQAIGVGVGVVYPGLPMQVLSYGLANAATRAPFGKHTLFETASISKVFTTNLLGQAVVNKQLSLSMSLGQFSAQLGTCSP